MDLDWLIIGGGIHGVHIAARLIGDARVAPERLRIVDPAPRLLDRWHTCTEATGMTFLRSPSVHNIDLKPLSLKKFARRQSQQAVRQFAPPYDRPALPLFNAHCDHVIESFGLHTLHISDRAVACDIDCEHVRVQLSSGQELTAGRLVLALGASEQPAWPDWAPRDHARVSHIYEAGFSGWPEAPETVVVLGGGITAGQVALRLTRDGHRVHMVSSHDLREHQFDSDSGWLGPKYMEGFRREPSLERRRTLITKARHLGSVPPGVHRALRRAIGSGALGWYRGTVTRMASTGDGIELQLDSGTALEAHRLILATGFASRRPGGALLDEMIASAALPCASCGYPVADAALRWHPRVHVSGPLAELELGPTARNIAGARQAGDRIVTSALRENVA